MSCELGGLSVTIRRVSLRACALASDQIAGAAVAAALAAAVVLKKVRRFIGRSPNTPKRSQLAERQQATCQRIRKANSDRFAWISQCSCAARSALLYARGPKLYAI